MKAKNYIKLLVLIVTLVGVTGCNRNDNRGFDDEKLSTVYVAETPAGVDVFEGNTGDDTLSTASSIKYR